MANIHMQPQARWSGLNRKIPGARCNFLGQSQISIAIAIEPAFRFEESRCVDERSRRVTVQFLHDHDRRVATRSRSFLSCSFSFSRRWSAASSAAILSFLAVAAAAEPAAGKLLRDVAFSFSTDACGAAERSRICGVVGVALAAAAVVSPEAAEVAAASGALSSDPDFFSASGAFGSRLGLSAAAHPQSSSRRLGQVASMLAHETIGFSRRTLTELCDSHR